MATPPKGYLEHIDGESANTEDPSQDSLPATPEIEPGKIPDSALTPQEEETPPHENPEG